MDIYAELTPIFQDVFDDDALTLSPTMVAADVEGWDSLAHLRLVTSIEQAFAIRFTTAEVATLRDVGELVAAIRSKRRT